MSRTNIENRRTDRIQLFEISGKLKIILINYPTLQIQKV